LVEAAKAVQEVLGERQDAAVARPVLREIAVQAHPEGESTFTYGLLHERQIARARQPEGQLSAVWRTTRRRAKPFRR
jgi:CHAD domain-containing protein